MGYHDFLSKLFCLTVPKKFLGGPFGFRKFVNLKNCTRWCITILSNNEFLTVPKSFVGEHFIFQEKIFYRKVLWLGRWRHDFLSKLFCLTVPKKILGGPFFQKSSGLKKLQKIVYHDFVEQWFSHTTEKFRGGLLQFPEKLFHRKFLCIGRGYHDFLSKILSHSTEKISRGTLVFQKVSGLKILHKMVYHNFVE